MPSKHHSNERGYTPTPWITNHTRLESKNDHGVVIVQDLISEIAGAVQK